MKQTADERIPGDLTEETSSSETKSKGMLGRIRVIPTIFLCDEDSPYVIGRSVRQDPPGTQRSRQR